MRKKEKELPSETLPRARLSPARSVLPFRMGRITSTGIGTGCQRGTALFDDCIGRARREAEASMASEGLCQTPRNSPGTPARERLFLKSECHSDHTKGSVRDGRAGVRSQPPSANKTRAMPLRRSPSPKMPRSHKNPLDPFASGKHPKKAFQ